MMSMAYVAEDRLSNGNDVRLLYISLWVMDNGIYFLKLFPVYLEK